MTHIYSYNEYSEGAKALSAAIGAKRIKHKNSKFKPRGKTVINWGSSQLPPFPGAKIINQPEAVALATNKLTFFKTFGEDSDLVVPYTTDVAKVREWLQAGKTVVARTKLTGHSGEGIVLLEGKDAEIVKAPLYTLYVPKKDEYRVHVARKQVENANNIFVFDIQRKAKKADVEEANFKIRNLANGFIYARNELVTPECVEDVALKAFEALGLDFGAIDIIYNAKQDRAYVLEVNTAPGLTGTTLDNYVKMFGEIL